MRTLGVDLATDPRSTATCLIDWTTGACEVRLGNDDDALLDAMAHADRIGIDAPFGWPDAFRAAIDAWSERGEWIAGADRAPLRLRETDRVAVQRGARPMSVSTNLLGATAMRCADLLHRAGLAADRVHGRAVEVYPAGSLAAWGITSSGYKGPSGRTLRREIASSLDDRGELGLSRATKERCAGSDHVLDGMICSLTARVVEQRRVREVTVTDQIAREGWIHLPTPDSLSGLRDGS